MKKIKKLMVANRGEIAVRIFRACHELGIKTLAIYSKEDIGSLFRAKADESYLVGENLSPLAAYLDIEGIIDLAKRKNVDAIHPGYGFLSENAEFAKACEEAGIIFIGPNSKVLGQMGDKINAKKMAIDAGVPIIPGGDTPLDSEEQAVELANKFGFPVILKAAAGGGGRGMRLAQNEKELRDSYSQVKTEALKAFGNDDIFIEKYLVNPKHIEVQILGDSQGNIVHLFERDCSVQRRYQKVVEYAPAFSISQETKKLIYRDALKIAQSVNYVNAGTIEFLVNSDGQHYFIEMNPRIQVEHTVTEMVTGIDIVQSQILIADGYSLDSSKIGITNQDAITINGYSIQCRVTTEDPKNNFLPDTGKISTYRSSGGFGVRLDAGNAFAGAEITPYYDSLLVKITTHARTFEGAIMKSLRAIGEIRIRGVKTNISFLNNILTSKQFVEGTTYTKFIDETPLLFDIEISQDRGTKVLKFLGEKIINEGPIQKPNFNKLRIPKGYEEKDLPEGVIKKILDQDGPEGVVKWIKNQKKLLITDTTLRDAHQSLLATRVRTRDMLNIALPTSHILKDAFSLEMWGGATFDTAYRFLKESPWVRLEELRERIPNIPFQMLIRGANAVGYTSYPDNVIVEFIKESAKAGIDIFRVFDSLNYVPNMELTIQEVLKADKMVEGAICYAGDIDDPSRPYDINYYIRIAKELEQLGCHTLSIKDMAGLLKPLAAKKLVAALKDNIDLPIHLHTHDTSGNQIAAYMMANEAGVDIVDCAISSMSSLTSQPSLNALVAALEGSDRDTGMNLDELQKLTDYWEDVRPLYQQFEADLKTPNTDIYRYEIPGGQYTNLKPQVNSLGLSDKFFEVKEMYREVNFMLGDIIKVTPSSKMVGDLAIFMIQNDLTPENLINKGKKLNFPDSTVSYFKGMMGQPKDGFPRDLQKIVLKGEKPITGKPGENLPPADFNKIADHLEKESGLEPKMRDIVSSCLYPKVYDEYIVDREKNSDISRMESSVFFMGMEPGETTELTIEDGKTLLIKYIGPLESNDDGTVDVLFELNGMRREVRVKDKTKKESGKRLLLADPDNHLEVGSSLPGAVSKILVARGDEVKENDTLAIIEAMKMEVNILAPLNGTIKTINKKEGDNIINGELMFVME